MGKTRSVAKTQDINTMKLAEIKRQLDQLNITWPRWGKRKTLVSLLKKQKASQRVVEPARQRPLPNRPAARRGRPRSTNNINGDRGRGTDDIPGNPSHTSSVAASSDDEAEHGGRSSPSTGWNRPVTSSSVPENAFHELSETVKRLQESVDRMTHVAALGNVRGTNLTTPPDGACADYFAGENRHQRQQQQTGGPSITSIMNPVSGYSLQSAMSTTAPMDQQQMMARRSGMSWFNSPLDIVQNAAPSSLAGPESAANIMMPAASRTISTLPVPITNAPHHAQEFNGITADAFSNVDIVSPAVRRDIIAGKDINLAALMIPGYKTDVDQYQRHIVVGAEAIPLKRLVRS